MDTIVFKRYKGRVKAKQRIYSLLQYTAWFIPLAISHSSSLKILFWTRGEQSLLDSQPHPRSTEDILTEMHTAAPPTPLGNSSHWCDCENHANQDLGQQGNEGWNLMLFERKVAYIPLQSLNLITMFNLF